MRIAFIGFGEAGRAFCDSLRRAEPRLAFAAHDLRRDDEMRAAMQARGVACAGDSADAAAGADWIVSAVTADQAGIAARKAASHLAAWQLFVDINSVAPATKRANAAAIAASGAGYLDMAVMAPVHPRGHATPVLVAGAALAEAGPVLDRLGFDWQAAGDEPGAATAIKMVRSVFVKGLEAITVEALLAARASGCLETVLASLSASYPGLGWPDIAAYHLERTLRHGARRAAEMEESAATLRALGLQGGLASAIAAVQAEQGRAGAGGMSGDLAADLDLTLARRLPEG